MKRLLAILTTSLVLMPEIVLAKGKAAGSCAQAVSQTAHDSFIGMSAFAIILIVGVYLVSRRRDSGGKTAKEADGSVVKTGIFGHP